MIVGLKDIVLWYEASHTLTRGDLKRDELSPRLLRAQDYRRICMKKRGSTVRDDPLECTGGSHHSTVATSGGVPCNKTAMGVWDGKVTTYSRGHIVMDAMPLRHDIVVPTPSPPSETRREDLTLLETAYLQCAVFAVCTIRGTRQRNGLSSAAEETHGKYKTYGKHVVCRAL